MAKRVKHIKFWDQTLCYYKFKAELMLVICLMLKNLEIVKNVKKAAKPENYG